MFCMFYCFYLLSFFSLVHSDIVIDVFLGLVQSYCQCTMLPFSPFSFMFLFVFVVYHATV